MDKRDVFRALEDQVQQTLRTLRASADAARVDATNPESKPENEYDTRGLEASYLASAQSGRAAELEAVIAMFRILEGEELPVFGGESPIGSTALVTVESEGQKFHYLLLPKGGGLSAVVEGLTVQIVTPGSPLGEALSGRSVGEEFELSRQRASREYVIFQVI